MTAHQKIEAQQAASAMPAHKNVYVALAAAQLSMEPVIKGALNPAFKGEGKPKGTAYADLADVVSAVRPVLAGNGLAYFHQMVMFDEKPAMRTVLCHGESDTSISCDVPLITDRANMQGMKSATTYAKRIGLESVTGVAPEDDDGNAAAAAPPPRAEATREDPAAEHDRDVAAAIKAINAEKALDSLGAYFGDIYRTQRKVADDPRVIAAKDARKAALMPAADIGGDEIPY